jgi:hypothetical protein
MKKRILKRRSDGTKQHYWVGRKKRNYGYRPKVRVRPEDEEAEAVLLEATEHIRKGEEVPDYLKRGMGGIEEYINAPIKKTTSKDEQERLRKQELNKKKRIETTEKNQARIGRYMELIRHGTPAEKEEEEKQRRKAEEFNKWKIASDERRRREDERSAYHSSEEYLQQRKKFRQEIIKKAQEANRIRNEQGLKKMVGSENNKKLTKREEEWMEKEPTWMRFTPGKWAELRRQNPKKSPEQVAAEEWDKKVHGIGKSVSPETKKRWTEEIDLKFGPIPPVLPVPKPTLSEEQKINRKPSWIDSNKWERAIKKQPKKTIEEIEKKEWNKHVTRPELKKGNWKKYVKNEQRHQKSIKAGLKNGRT